MDLYNLGLKQTKTRKTILDIMTNSKELLSADDVYKLVIDQGINLSTVYRTLTSFHELGIISKEIGKDGKAMYLYIRDEHHHVLICTKCGKRIYLKDCPYIEFDAKIYNQTGFKIQNHNIELYGLCKDCQ